MKVDEAPEKIYISPLPNPSDGYVGIAWDEPHKTMVGYIRKDAFIEKACQFIKEHHHEFSFWNTEEYELGFSTQKFIEDFKKYMEGE